MKFTSSQRFLISFWLMILNLLVWVGKLAYGLYMDHIYATYFKKGITLDYILPIHILGALLTFPHSLGHRQVECLGGLVV